MPGLDKVYGVAKGDGLLRAGREGPAAGEPCGHADYICAIAPELFEKLRDAHGFDFHLLHDVHHRLTPIEAARLGKDSSSRTACSGSRTPTPAENQEAFRLIRQHTTTPLAVGEVFNSIWDCKDLIANS